VAKIHRLKTCAPYFEDVNSGRKTFEVRRNDRDYRVGDYLVLDAWMWSTERGHHYPAFSPIVRYVTYVLHGGQYGIADDHVVMGIDEVEHEDSVRTVLDLAPPRPDLRPEAVTPNPSESKE
jgi:hypothetical protein